MSLEHFKQITEYLDEMLWFHGTIRRERAEAMLIRRGEFLVRQSESYAGQIFLTVMTIEDYIVDICLVSNDARVTVY